MKSCYIALLICLLGWNGFAQTAEGRKYIGLTMAPGFHVGNLNYVSKDRNIEHFEKIGYLHNLVNFGSLLRNKKNLGISASWFYGETFVANKDENDWWQFTAITAGPMLSYRLSEKLHLDIKWEFGFAGTTAVIDQHVVLGDDDYFGGGFAMDYCTTLRYNFYRRWCLLLEGGYITSNQKFYQREVKIREIYSGIGLAFLMKTRFHGY